MVLQAIPELLFQRFLTLVEGQLIAAISASFLTLVENLTGVTNSLSIGESAIDSLLTGFVVIVHHHAVPRKDEDLTIRLLARTFCQEEEIPCLPGRSAQRIKDFSRKKRLLALLPKSVDIQRRHDQFAYLKLELENSLPELNFWILEVLSARKIDLFKNNQIIFRKLNLMKNNTNTTWLTLGTESVDAKERSDIWMDS